MRAQAGAGNSLLAALHAERQARHGRPPDAAGGAAPGPAGGGEARAAGAAPPAVSLLTWNLWCAALAAGPRLCVWGRWTCARPARGRTAGLFGCQLILSADARPGTLIGFLC